MTPAQAERLVWWSLSAWNLSDNFPCLHNKDGKLNKCLKENLPWVGFEPTSPRILVGYDNHYTIRTTTLATQQSKMWFMWLKMWAFREIFFQGDKVVEAYNSICNQSKDQVNDARQEVNLVS